MILLCWISDTRLNYGQTHGFRPVRLVLETFWDMCYSSEAYNRSDSAIFHSLSIPFKVSLDLLFTDSHLHCQGASRDLNQVLPDPAQANIFTRVCLLNLIYCILWASNVFVRGQAKRRQHVSLWERHQEVCVREMLNEQQVHTSIARREGQVAMTLLISRQQQA